MPRERLFHVVSGGLGWRPPVDRDHETRYALSTAMPEMPCPVVIGIPWYSAFDRPEQRDGVYWIGTSGNWGTVRGGHCVCLRPPMVPDVVGAHRAYDQRQEGACVGFGTSRAASLYNGAIYDGFSLYYAAQKRDEFPGEAYSGTTVNAGLQTLRIDGAWRLTPSGPVATRRDGCKSFLWASTALEIADALKTGEGFVRILNSWGLNYPAEVRMPLEALARLMSEDGEAGVPVDRMRRMRTANGDRAT